MVRIAGLASDRGRNLVRIHDRAPGGAEVAVLVADDAGAPALGAAEERGIPVVVAPEAHELPDLLADYGVDLVCLDGYEGEFPAAVTEAVPTVLGAHRSLLPTFPGEDPVRAALDAGVRVTGCTVHAVTGGARPIVTQEPVLVYGDDDPETLAERIEREGAFAAYPRAVELIASGRATVDGDAVAIDGDGDDGGPLPARWRSGADRLRGLRYGENPHQEAAVYADATVDEANVVRAEQVNEGARALSYNNYNDADAALDLVKEFNRPAAAVIKHTNPAGCATAGSIAEAYDRALSTDPMSAFGGIVALNRACDTAAADAITESFKEVVVAPGYGEDALAILSAEENLRVLDVGPLGDRTERIVETPLTGGRLVQERDLRTLTAEDLEVVTEREPTEEQVESLLFAWHVAKHVKSNAIVFVVGTETAGIGAGQMSRVDAVRIAAMKAEEHAEGKSAAGGVMASDAFFPFPDGVEAAAEAGIEAVIQPGGSVNDEDVIAAADDLGLAMVHTGTRCFRHS